jgi:hypothetical protein
MPQPVLLIINGFQCQDCDFKTQNRQAARKHSNKKHGKKRLKDEELFRAVQLQTWFREKRARYWVVDATRQSRDVNNGSSGSGSDSRSGSDAAIKAEVAEWIKKEEEETKYEVSTVATEADPWLQQMGWEEALAGSKHGLVETATFAATATATEPELEILFQSWERILQRGLETLKAVSGFKDILKWWASPQPKEVSQKPFEAPQPKSIQQYSQTFARLLYYVIRTAPESINDETETGVVFSASQLQEVKNVREALAVAVADNASTLDTAVF